MTIEITHLVQEMDTLLNEMRELLVDASSACDMKEKQRKFGECDIRRQQFRTVKEAIILEGRNLNETQKRNLEETVKRRLVVFKDLCQQVEDKKSEVERAQLEEEANYMDPTGGGGGQQTQSQQLMHQGDKLQDQTDEAIQRMKGLVIDAEQVGIATAAKMDQQLEQMGKIGENLNDVEYNTKRAKKTAAQIARNATHDLCIQILCGGILICLIIIIILVNV